MPQTALSCLLVVVILNFNKNFPDPTPTSLITHNISLKCRKVSMHVRGLSQWVHLE
jgi:hypothetical protein